jgi:hypothetical protein
MSYKLLAFLFAASLFAQGRIDGPIVGWIWDAGSARPVLGIPGAAILGERLQAELAWTRAAVSPNGDYILAISAEQGLLYLVSTRSGALREVEGVAGGADDIVLSPGGRSALLHYRAENRIAVLAGLPEQPNLAGSLDVSVEGAPDTLAISDDASVAVAGFRDQRALLAFDVDGNRWKVPYEGAARHVSFIEGRPDALVAGENGLWRLNDVAGNVESRLLWETSAMCAAATPDRRHVILIDGADAVVILSLESGVVRRLESGVKPTTLARMAENVFRISDFDSGPLWILDMAGADPRILFVPADAKAEKND